MSIEVNPRDKRLRFRFIGLDCSNCARVVGKQLSKREGIKRVGASLMTDTVLVDYDPNLISEVEIEETIKKTGLKFTHIDSILR
jgi:copper chaperone CopZ